MREFRARAIVGSRPGELIALILREAGASTVPGLILGVLLALGFARALKAIVYQVSPLDPLSIAVPAGGSNDTLRMAAGPVRRRGGSR